MTQKTGRCKNYGICANADSRKLLQADDTNFICPECGKTLVPVADPGKAGGGQGYWIIGGVAAAVLAIAVGVGYLLLSPNRQESIAPAPVSTSTPEKRVVEVRPPLQQSESDTERRYPGPTPEPERDLDGKTDPATGRDDPVWAPKPASDWIKAFPVNRR